MHNPAKPILCLLPLLLGALALGGCGASLGSITTGSLFGKKAEAAAAPQPQNDSVARAIQVGTTSARAVKCGFNFDPAKLKTNFLAAETAASPADVAKFSEVYDVSFRGVSKAVASQGDEYCSDTKTIKIKEALNRHLAGDYTPSPPEPKAEDDDDGLFGNLTSGSNSGYKTPNPWSDN